MFFALVQQSIFWYSEHTMKRKKNIKTFARRYGIQLLLLFGSWADGTAHTASDFDIAYYSEEDLDLMAEARMIVELAPFVKSEDIDLVNMKKAPPLLLYAIFLKPKILYMKDSLLFYNLRTYAFKKYVEAKPLFDEVSRRLRERFGK